MFEIEYKGANSVIISTKKSKIVVDPNLSIVGMKNVSVDNAIELVTEPRFAINDNKASLLIDSPGEYGIAGFDIRGIAARRHIDGEAEGMQSTMYRIEVGETRIGVLGNVWEKLSDEQLEGLGILDVLIIPVGGGGYTLDAEGAASVVRMINPKVVIPVHYADSSIKYEVPQDELSRFINELGVQIEKVSKYKYKSQIPGSTGISIIEIVRS